MRLPARLAGAGLLLAGAAQPACVTDHDALAKGSDRGGGGAGGSAGGAGFPSVRGGESGGGTGGREPDEPPGEDVLTIVNGIVDAPVVRLCFRAGADDATRFVEAPEGASALAYAASLVVGELADVDFDAEALEPVAIAGELERVSELDCEEAVETARIEQAAAEPPATGAGGEGGSGEPSDPPRLRTAALPILPAGTLTRGRSTVLVLDGCMGGAAFAGADAELACGEGYSPRNPTLGAVWVNLSRRSTIGKLGLQVVQASRATEVVTLASKRIAPSSEPPIPIASSVAYGTVAPRVPAFDRSSADYGANTELFFVEAVGAVTPGSSETWSAIRERARVEALEDGKTYALVVVGPSAGLAAEGFWNAPAIALVATDPAPP